MAEFVIKIADERGHLLEQIENGYSEAEVRDRFVQQGFLVYWTRTSTTERSFARDGVMQALRGHHKDVDSADAHPTSGFNVPEWGGEAHASAATLLGNASATAVA